MLLRYLKSLIYNSVAELRVEYLHVQTLQKVVKIKSLKESMTLYIRQGIIAIDIMNFIVSDFLMLGNKKLGFDNDK